MKPVKSIEEISRFWASYLFPRMGYEVDEDSIRENGFFCCRMDDVRHMGVVLERGRKKSIMLFLGAAFFPDEADADSAKYFLNIVQSYQDDYPQLDGWWEAENGEGRLMNCYTLSQEQCLNEEDMTRVLDQFEDLVEEINATYGLFHCASK